MAGPTHTTPPTLTGAALTGAALTGAALTGATLTGAARVVFLVALSACLGLLGPAAPPAQGAGMPAAATATATATASVRTAAAPSPSAYERRLQHWTNVQRRRHGLREVRASSCPDGYAERWTRRLARSGRLYHRDQREVLRGCHATTAGEVLARGRVSPRRMVRMWMGSPGHRDILLSRSFRQIGVGAQRLRDGTWLATQNYIRR